MSHVGNHKHGLLKKLCKECHNSFKQKVKWQEFCKRKCLNKYHNRLISQERAKRRKAKCA